MYFFLLSIGRDTTVHSLSWIIYSIHCTGAAPEVIKNLVREVDNVLQDKLPPHETYKQQKYAEARYGKPVLIDVTKKLVPFFFSAKSNSDNLLFDFLVMRG